MFSELSRPPLAWAAMLLLVVGMTFACGTEQVDYPGGITEVAEAGDASSILLLNLQIAYEGERNTAARYIAYAKEADKSGYARTASLFRAAAKAEEIHAKNHAEVIRSINAEPKADLEVPEIGSTTANLWKAIQDESKERDSVYPGMIKQARETENAAAVRTFTLARSSETGHALLYQGAFETLKERRSAPTQYFVCPGCGFTRTKLEGMTNCPACKTPMAEFILVK